MSAPESLNARPFDVNDRPRVHEWVKVNLHTAGASAPKSGQKRSLALPIIVVLVCVGGLIALAVMFLSGGANSTNGIRAAPAAAGNTTASTDIKPAEISARFGKKTSTLIEVIADVKLSSKEAKLDEKTPLEIEGLQGQKATYEVKARGENRYEVKAAFRPKLAQGQVTIKDVRYQDGLSSLNFPDEVVLPWDLTPTSRAARPAVAKPAAKKQPQPAKPGLKGTKL